MSMDTGALTYLRGEAQWMREVGIALVVTSAILAAFLFIPTGEIASQEAAAVVPIEEPVAPAPDAYASVPLTAQAAIVYDLATGEVLYGKNIDAQLPLASLTKLLAVYTAVTTLPQDATITISHAAAMAEAPRLFNEDQAFALSDLSRLTLTASLNDGASAIVEAAAAKRARSTAETLSSAAAELNLATTYAVNGNGLDENEMISGGYGSARDMAQLAGALVRIAPDIAYATTRSFTSASSVGGTEYKVKNTNPIVETFPSLLLSKTGFTDLAGGNLAIVFDAGIGHPVAVVVLGSTKEARFTDTATLVRATFAYFAGRASL